MLNSTVIVGPLVSTVVQSYREGYAQVFRLHEGNSDDSRFVEVTYALGVIDDGAEVITRINSDILSGGSGTFYTVCTKLNILKSFVESLFARIPGAWK